MRLQLLNQFCIIGSMKDKYILASEPSFPSLLSASDPTVKGLFVRGKLLTIPCIAIVGTRTPSSYGLKMVAQIVPLLVSHGFCIVSGLARGVDTAAHKQALMHGGKTMAVLAGGVANIYPPENIQLAEKITESGALLSENKPNYFVHQSDFLYRNRIVAGLSVATVVIEGRARSGTFSTANYAVSFGREVYAVPGPIDSPLSAAPNKLIQLGAQIITDAKDFATTVSDLYL